MRIQSSIEEIDLNDLENIFVSEARKGKTSIKVAFKPNSQGLKRKKSYQFDISRNDTRDAGDTSIREGNKPKGFFTYKHLLTTHYLKKDEAINLFDLLLKGELKHFVKKRKSFWCSNQNPRDTPPKISGR